MADITTSFPAVERRTIFTFGGSGSSSHETILTSTGRRPQTCVADWGGSSLDQVLSSQPRELPMAPPVESTLPVQLAPSRRPRVTREDFGGSLDEVLATRPSHGRAAPPAAAPAPPAPSERVQAANVDAWGGGLDEVMLQRVRTRPSVHEYNPAPPRAVALRTAAAADEWGGDLGQVMQQQRARPRHRRFADIDCEDDQQQHQTHHHQQPPPPPPLSASLAQLITMGFNPAAARAALHRHRTVDAAIDALALEAAATPQPPSPLEPPSGAAAFEAASRRPHRGPVVTAEEWGGGLGDVLRPPAPPRRSHSAAHAAAPQDHATRAPRYSQAHAPSLPPHGTDGSGGGSGSRGSRGSAPPPADEYYDLMQMHMRDNVDASKKVWQEDWRCVLKLFTSVKPPSRSRTQRPPASAATDGAPAAEEEAECCSICIEPLHTTCAHLKGPSHGPATAVCSLPCGHTFHRKCLTECVKRGHWTCPNCRDDLRKRL